MKKSPSPLLFAGVLLLCLSACKKDNNTTPAPIPVRDTISALSVERTKTLAGGWRLQLSGVDRNNDNMLDSSETDITPSGYTNRHTFNADGSARYQTFNDTTLLSEEYSQWRISNSGQQLLSIKGQDTIRVTIQKLLNTTFEGYRQNSASRILLFFVR